MPEEINRIVTDRLADLLFTPSADGDANLAAEGIPTERIHLVGNVMVDTLDLLLPVARSRWPELQRRFALDRFILVTLHRPSNVDDPIKLRELVGMLAELSSEMPMVFPIHPRTRDVLVSLHFKPPATLMMIESLGYLDFLALQDRATLVITDSGGVQEETTSLGIPCLTMRENTERPVTVTIGTNVLVGNDLEMLRRSFRAVLHGGGKKGKRPPLWDGHAAQRIADVLIATGR